MTKPASLIDSTKDTIEKFTGATHRAGASVQRAYALVEAGVDPAVAALQMSYIGIASRRSSSLRRRRLH
jgi:hypothetical protein